MEYPIGKLSNDCYLSDNGIKKALGTIYLDRYMMKMTPYQKVFSFVYGGFFLLIMGLLIYASTISDDESLFKQRLQTVSPDSLSHILITPKHPDWKVNLTLDTIRIADKATMAEITGHLNRIDEKYPGRGLPQTWEAYLILGYKNNKDIRLEVVDAKKGICVFLTNTMRNSRYRCNGLKAPLEAIANYTGNLGKRE